MQIVSLFTYSHVVLNLFDFIFFLWNIKKNIYSTYIYICALGNAFI